MGQLKRLLSRKIEMLLAVMLALATASTALAAEISKFTSGEVFLAIGLILLVQLSGFALSIAIWLTTVRMKKYNVDQAALSKQHTDDQTALGRWHLEDQEARAQQRREDITRHVDEKAQVKLYMDRLHDEYDAAKRMISEQTKAQQDISTTQTDRVLAAVRELRNKTSTL